MSKLSSAKPKIVPKPFVELQQPKLYIAVSTNDRNQITAFDINYKDKAIRAEVKGLDIEKAWKTVEAFIVKHAKAK